MSTLHPKARQALVRRALDAHAGFEYGISDYQRVLGHHSAHKEFRHLAAILEALIGTVEQLCNEPQPKAEL